MSDYNHGQHSHLKTNWVQVKNCFCFFVSLAGSFIKASILHMHLVSWNIRDMLSLLVFVSEIVKELKSDDLVDGFVR